MLIRDTWNTDIISELKPTTEDRIVYKHRFSGFFETLVLYRTRPIGSGR